MHLEPVVTRSWFI